MMGVWRQAGFEDFARGKMGNAGQNLYVSRAGVLQRIHQYSIQKSGYVDLPFCNSQDHWERAPAYIYPNPLKDTCRISLPSDGAMSGAVADLNGDGYDDLVLGMWANGIRQDLNALIYFGGPDGFSEARVQYLPAPLCRSVAVGDFNGDGKPDVAFLLDKVLRVFYQTELGFEPRRFVEYAIQANHISAFDIDRDRFCDLLVRRKDGAITVYWGHPDGLSLERSLQVLVGAGKAESVVDEQSKYTEYVEDASLLARAVVLGGVPHIFIPLPDSVLLLPVTTDRRFGEPLRLNCPQAMAVAVGDVNGDGFQDLAFACRDQGSDDERSWIYWGSAQGFSDANRAALKTSRACDVAVADLNADGCDEVILCQCHTRESYSNPSFLYRGTRQGVSSVPVQLPTEDARRVFVTQGTRDTDSRVVFVNHFSRGVKGNVDALIYLGGPEGYTPSRKVALPGWGAVEAVCADLNDDGRVDVVLANCSENSVSDDPGSYVFFHGPNGLPHSPSLRLPTTRAHGVCCADVNRDGYLDLIFVGFTNPEILVFHGTRDGFDTAHPVRIRLEHGGVKYDQPRWIYLVDLNNDGWLDLVVPQIAFDRSFVLWGGPDGFSMKNCQVLSVERAACARAADLTGNGYADLILGGHAPSENTPHDSFVYIYWNGPEGLRNDRRCMLPASGINSLCVADFNNDGLLDLFVGSYHAVKSRDVDSYLYWNRKDRGFSASDCKRLFTHSASGCVAADFNEDGWIDLAVANHKVWGDHRGYSEVWWNGPDGFDPRRTTRLPTWGPHGMTAVGPGNILTRGPEEYYESCPHQLPRGASPTRISWQAEAPPKTWVKAQLRSAHSKDALSSAPWLGPDGPGSWFENGQRVAPRSLSGEWIQYRLALGATNSVASPRVTEVAVEYEG